MKALYNFIRKPAQKFFLFAGDEYRHKTWHIPVMVLVIALQTQTMPPRAYVIAFAMYMGLFYGVSWACRYFVRELDPPPEDRPRFTKSIL